MCWETVVGHGDSAPFIPSRVEGWTSKCAAPKPSKLWTSREKGRKCFLCLYFLLFWESWVPAQSLRCPRREKAKTPSKQNLRPQVLALGAPLTASTPPSAEAPLPVPLESPSLQAVPGVSAKPLSPPFTAGFVPPSASAPRHPFPFPSSGRHQGLQPMKLSARPSLPSSKLPGSHLQVTALKFSRKGPGVRRPRLQIPALPLSRWIASHRS